MKQQSLGLLRCPRCHGSLLSKAIETGTSAEHLDDGELSCVGCLSVWPVRSGMPHLLWPDALEAEDLRSLRLWNRIAPFWTTILRLTNVIRGVRDGEERRALVRRLGLKPGGSVLETAAGDGANLEWIAREAQHSVSMFGVDLSPRMLAAARRRFRNSLDPPELIVGNAINLPFDDNTFDAALDGFGMKYYSDKRRAMEELLRVVKPGGKVVISEIGLPSRSAPTVRQRLLLLSVPGIGEPPGSDVIPSHLGVVLAWDAHRTAFTIEFRKPDATAGAQDEVAPPV